MNQSLRQIEVFHAVARTLHFGQAAEELFMTQPIVSQEIRRLETKLGVRLFDRSTRRVSLTAAGEYVLPAAQAVIDAVQEFETSASLATGLDGRRIRLVASPSAMNVFVPRVLRRAEEELPELAVEDRAVETGEVARILLDGEADVGVGRFLELPPSFTQVVVGTDEVLVALSAQNALAPHERIDPAAFMDLPLLLWPRERSPQYFDALLDICHRRGLDPMLLVSQPRIIGSRSYLIAENRAFSLVPRSAQAVVTPGIVTRPLADPASVPLSAAWRTGDTRKELLSFVSLLRQIHAGTP